MAPILIWILMIFLKNHEIEQKYIFGAISFSNDFGAKNRNFGPFLILDQQGLPWFRV